MAFVSAFVAAVPSANKEKYLEMSRKTGAFFKEKGATRVVECWGADVPDGKLTSFPLAVKKADDETIALGWVEWPSKDLADAAFGEMMSDPQFSTENMPMPFDGQRMIFGGFDMILES